MARWGRSRTFVKRIFMRGGRRRGGASPMRVRKAFFWGAIGMVFIMMCAPNVRAWIVAKFSQWFPNWRA